MTRLVAIALLVAACRQSRPESPRPELRAGNLRGVSSETHTVISPMEPQVGVGDSVQLGAMTVVTDASGVRSASCAPTWQSFDPGIATVSATGWLVGRRPGLVTIRAACSGIAAGTTAQVRP